MFSRRVLGADNVVTSREAKGTNKEKPHCVRHCSSHVSAGSVAPVPRSADAPAADHAPAEPHPAAPSPAARTVAVPLPAAPAQQVRAPELARAPWAATGIQGRWRQVPWSGSCNGGVAATVTASSSNHGEERVHGVFSMVGPSMVTPARFERATFPLGGGRPFYRAQEICSPLCQLCAKPYPRNAPKWRPTPMPGHRPPNCVKATTSGEVRFRPEADIRFTLDEHP